MASVGPNYPRLRADKHITVQLAPTSDATGIENVAEPLEDELEVPGTRGFVNASRSISWNDFDFGVQESERTTDPSLADDSTYEDFGQINYGGGMSFYYPQDYDDASNNHSLVYDLTDVPWSPVDVVERIDGNKEASTPIVTGDFVHTFRTLTDGEGNNLTGADALRRTVSFLSQGEMAIYTVVGEHALTVINTPAFAVGEKGRLRVSVQDRDYTNALQFQTSDPDVIRILPGGFYEVTGTGTATITVRDADAGTQTTVEVSNGG